MKPAGRTKLRQDKAVAFAAVFFLLLDVWQVHRLKVNTNISNWEVYAVLAYFFLHKSRAKIVVL